MTNEIDDEIVEAIRRRRQAHAESLDYDLKRITEDLQRQERESGEPVVRRPSSASQAASRAETINGLADVRLSVRPVIEALTRLGLVSAGTPSRCRHPR